MAQLNLQITKEFAAALKRYMQKSGIKKKSEAVRRAVIEAAQRLEKTRRKAAFSELLGAGLRAPLNQSPKFKSDDDLWS